eukprot:CAMPEP_0195521584 /NCGR_PEP_ID=MMETSP0794_2-20130614/18980_1 /TAXON_ID=515487 /ORGANISM="Stephanopyxis turris, Strain CCMP 815" /LENGTH=252 /DNA_ID=CAMNT_0040651165 /DNA_START=339 /DNA_END=1097 /DNA_ORIENTATION=-
MDVGLVISRYGSCLSIGDGVCVAGDPGAHYEVVFKLLVFRPFVDEVCVGTIMLMSEEGVRVSLGFFEDVFIPAHWMLRPSAFDNESGCWAWTPNYDDDDGDDDDDEEEEGEGKGDRFEMEIGAEIRFKVKALHFTRVTNTAKGVQATTSTTSHENIVGPMMSRSRALNTDGGGDDGGAGAGGGDNERPVRRRSSSVDLSDATKIPPSFYIVGSICEDGLGLTSWWSAPEEDEEEGGEEGEEEVGEEFDSVAE